MSVERVKRMKDYIKEKVVVVTGAASGFGYLLSEKLVGLGAKVLAADINEEQLEQLAKDVHSEKMVTLQTDVTERSAVERMIQVAIDAFGRVDVLINNAGTMPLGYLKDHQKAMAAWENCIDTNIKGVFFGMAAVHDQMIAQGSGQIINVSSIYGNGPVAGGSPYGMTKRAVGFLTDSLRTETKGQIKMTTIRPTFCPTNLASTIINPAAGVGLMSNGATEASEIMSAIRNGTADPKYTDPDSMSYFLLDPRYITDSIIYCINQPAGVSISDMTIRASGDAYTE